MIAFSWWRKVMGRDDRRFRGIPLWDWDPGSFQKSNFEQYGGWPAHMRVGVQKVLEFELRGINVDVSYFNDVFLK
jgi:hypothetical protein